MDTYCNKLAAAMGGWVLDLVWWFILAALVLAVAWAAAVTAEKIKAIRAVPPPENTLNPAPADANVIIDAIAGLVQALASAPAWFALFLAGVGLLWMASAAVPQACVPPVKSVTTTTTTTTTTSNTTTPASKAVTERKTTTTTR